MSVDTEIIINSKWSVEDICALLKSHLELTGEVTWKNTHTPEYTTIHFCQIGHKARSMSYHRTYPTPLGNAVLLTLGCNDEAQQIMQMIGNAIGGFYQPSDTRDEYELMAGMLNIHNGIPYFLESAVINDKLSDDNDLKGLGKYISEWHKTHGR